MGVTFKLLGKLGGKMYLGEEEGRREARGSSKKSPMKEFGIQLQEKFATVLRIKVLWSDLSHPNEVVLT